MTIKNNSIETKPLAEKLHIPQYCLPMILFMFAWPAVWFTLLIYVVGKAFIPEGGTTPTWLMIAIIVLGTAAELAAGLVLLCREGYDLTFSSLQDRIRWRWPKGWKAWTLAGVVFKIKQPMAALVLQWL